MSSNDVSGISNVYKAATTLSIESGRIVFTHVYTRDEHIRRGQLADVCLDTIIYNGHMTSMNILWSGTPIVTLPGFYTCLTIVLLVKY